MECYTYLRNVTDLLSDGKTPYERRFGQPFKGPIVPFGSLVEYHPRTAKDQSRIHQFGKKVLPGLFLGYALYAGGIWKGDVLVADLEELETMDASEIYSKKTQCKRGDISQRRRNQPPWRRSRSENIHLDTAATNSRRESHWFSWRIRRVSSTTSRLISGCPWSYEWFLVHVRKLHIPPSRWTQSQTLLAERRIIPYSTEIHWRLQNYSYEFGCQAREAHRWLLEYRWDKRFVWSMDRFHSIYCKYNTSNDMFSRCKSVQKMATGKGDDQLKKYDNKWKLETSYKLKLGPRWHWDQEWKIKNCPWMRGDTARCVHQWQHDHFHRLPHCLSVSARCLVLLVCTSSRAHTHRVSSNESFTPSTCPCSCERFSSLCSPFYFQHFLPHSIHFLLHLKFVDYNTTCCALRTKRVWTCLTSSSSPQVMSPTPTTSRWPQSSPTRSSWTRRRSSPTNSSADADCDDAALEGMLDEAHRVHSHHSLREDLSVSLSSTSMSDRTWRPVEQRNQEAQMRNLLDKQKEQILAECQQEIADTNFKPLTTEEAY